jgi:hypothetical protein
VAIWPLRHPVNSNRHKINNGWTGVVVLEGKGYTPAVAVNVNSRNNTKPEATAAAAGPLSTSCVAVEFEHLPAMHL